MRANAPDPKSGDNEDRMMHVCDERPRMYQMSKLGRHNGYARKYSFGNISFQASNRVAADMGAVSKCAT